MTTPLLALHGPGWPEGATPVPAVVVLLHGYGSSEHDLAGLAGALGLTLPWVSLRAPIDTPHGGAAWFRITTPGDPAAQPVAVATDAIWSWIDTHLHPDTTVVPIGFSQGGLMASQLLRTRPHRVLAPVILGGFVAGTPQPADSHLNTARPPAFWGRGEDDRVITAAAIARTAGYLPQHTQLTERVYPGLAHSISKNEIEDVKAFLGRHMGLSAVTGR